MLRRVPGYSTGSVGLRLAIGDDARPLSTGGWYEFLDMQHSRRWLTNIAYEHSLTDPGGPHPQRFDRFGAEHGSAFAQCIAWHEPSNVAALWVMTWWDDDGEYHEDCYQDLEGSISAEEFKILAADDRAKRQSFLDRARARVAGAIPSGRREAIPDSVKMFVWQRDGGRCTRCGSNENLEFDHIIPLARGGANTERNLQLLCEPCNRLKGANLS